MAMTLLRVCRAPAISGHSFLCRRRLAVPAFWLLTSFSLGIGIVSLHPFQTQSQPLLPPLRLNITSRISAKGLHSSGMEGNANVVPSIVVYVTVPSKEAAKSTSTFLTNSRGMHIRCVSTQNSLRQPGYHFSEAWRSLPKIKGPEQLNKSFIPKQIREGKVIKYCIKAIPDPNTSSRTFSSNFKECASFFGFNICFKYGGKKLAESIVTEKLAACVNRVPGIESVYWWEGQVQSDAEELLIIKTRESLLDALTQHIKANHEYDLPEVIALPIQGGNIQYLEWIKNSTRDP